MWVCRRDFLGEDKSLHHVTLREAGVRNGGWIRDDERVFDIKIGMILIIFFYRRLFLN